MASYYASLVESISGLQGYWRCNETTGSSAADSSGKGNTGTWNGTYTLGAPGPIVGDSTSYSANLTGTAGWCIVPDSTGLVMSGSSTVTIGCWVLPTTQPTNGYPAFITKQNNSGYGYGLYQAAGSGAGPFVSFTNTGSTGAQAPPSPQVEQPWVGAWIFYVGVWTGGYIYEYLNGLQVGASAALSGTLFATTGYSLYIGANYDAGSPVGMTGYIAEAFVASTALTQAQILQLYGVGMGGKGNPRGDGLKMRARVVSTRSYLDKANPSWQVGQSLVWGPTIDNDTIYGTSTIPVPTVGSGAGAAPAVVAATSTIPAPTIFAGSGAAPAPGVLAATSTIPAPTVHAGATVAPAAVAATSSLPAPTLYEPAIASLQSTFSSMPWFLDALSGDVTPTASGGQLSITCDSSYPEAGTAESYQLIGSSVFAQFICPTTSGTDRSVYMELDLQGSGNAIGIINNTGTLQWYYAVAGSYTYAGSTTFNGTTMAWWRIREVSGTVYFDTAPDGSTWTNQYSWAYGSTFTNLAQGVRLAIGAGTYGADPTATVYVQNLNVSAVNANVTPAVVAATSTIPAPTLSASASPAPAALAATSTVPGPGLGAYVTASPAVFNATSTVPAVTGSAGAHPAPSAYAATSTVPALTGSDGGSIVTVAVVATSTIPAPSVGISFTGAPAVVSATSTVPAPSVGVGYAPAPSAVAATSTVPAPTLSAGAYVTPAVVAATSTIPAPTVAAGGSVNVTPAVFAATSSIPAPTVAASAGAAPAVVAATSSIPAPTAFAGQGAAPAPAVIAATSTVPAPSLVAGTGASVTPAVVAATSTVPAPTLSAQAAAAPAVVTATSTVPAPTESDSDTILPVAVAATSTIPAPTVSAGAHPLPAAFAATSSIPAVSPSAAAGPAPAAVAATSTVPTVADTAGAAVLPAALVATSTIPAPTVSSSQSSNVTPAVFAATSAIPAPSVSAGVAAAPAAVAATSTVPALVGSAGSRPTPAVVAATSVLPALVGSSSANPSGVGGFAGTSGFPGTSEGAGDGVTPGTFAASSSIPPPTVVGIGARTSTQPGISRVQIYGQYGQPAVSRISALVSYTNTARVRISVTNSTSISGQGWIIGPGVQRTITQSATSLILTPRPFRDRSQLAGPQAYSDRWVLSGPQPVADRNQYGTPVVSDD